MDLCELSFVKKKLGRFLRNDVLEGVIKQAISECGLIEKNDYSVEEMHKILERMIGFGGFCELVARNIKARLILRK
ncbi:hypothetical protein KAI68_02575 [bacterium]|nr:hypothetical protein [bacterium]